MYYLVYSINAVLYCISKYSGTMRCDFDAGSQRVFREKDQQNAADDTDFAFASGKLRRPGSMAIDTIYPAAPVLQR